MKDCKAKVLATAVLAAALVAHGAVNIPLGTYIYAGSVVDFRNTVQGAESGLTIYAVSTNGTVLSSCKLVDPDGKNCILCKYVNGEKVKDLGKAGEVVHLYAGWKSSYRYQVCFNRNDGTGATMTQVMLRDKDVGLAWKDSQIGWTRAGYSFKGWAESASGAVKYANGATVRNIAAAGATKQLYAVWTKTDSVSAAPRIMASSVAAPKSAVPEWAVGTFYGEDGDSFATVTVSAGGEVSGIVLFDNDTWTIEGTASGLSIDAEVVDESGSSRPMVLRLSLDDDGRTVIESDGGSIRVMN